MQLKKSNFYRDINYLILGIISVEILWSCNFNITDNPGPQISSSIESARKHHTLICSYKLNVNTINKVPIQSIFVEKKYFLSKGLFKDFDINCCESQMVIIFKEDNNTMSLNGVPLTWSIVGFDQPNSRMMVKYSKESIWPDTVQILVQPNVENKGVTEELTLFKMK